MEVHGPPWTRRELTTTNQPARNQSSSTKNCCPDAVAKLTMDLEGHGNDEGLNAAPNDGVGLDAGGVDGASAQERSVVDNQQPPSAVRGLDFSSARV
jgi:hypothetical protein